MPDYPWEWLDGALVLSTPWGKAELQIQAQGPKGGQTLILKHRLIRCGEIIQGDTEPADPVTGWASITYGDKHPALSMQIRFISELPVTIQSIWSLYEKSE